MEDCYDRCRVRGGLDDTTTLTDCVSALHSQSLLGGPMACRCDHHRRKGTYIVGTRTILVVQDDDDDDDGHNKGRAAPARYT